MKEKLFNRENGQDKRHREGTFELYPEGPFHARSLKGASFIGGLPSSIFLG
jgi:hypothetical protein